MQHSDFQIGVEFKLNGARYRCTDVGSRTVIAIRIDEVAVVEYEPKSHSLDQQAARYWPKKMNYIQAHEAGLFNGPPYALEERVFDENDIIVCAFWP